MAPSYLKIFFLSLSPANGRENEAEDPVAQRRTQLAALRWGTAGGCQRFEDSPPDKEEKGEEACVVGGTAGGSPRTH